MPNLTPNYNFKKPIKATENADIDVLNSNMDTLDTELKKVSDKANTKEIIVIESINISKNNWELVSSTPQKIYANTIKNVNITSKDSVEINFSFYNISNNQTEGILNLTQSFDNGTCQIYSYIIPIYDLNATMIIQKGA